MAPTEQSPFNDGTPTIDSFPRPEMWAYDFPAYSHLPSTSDGMNPEMAGDMLHVTSSFSSSPSLADHQGGNVHLLQSIANLEKRFSCVI